MLSQAIPGLLRRQFRPLQRFAAIKLRVRSIRHGDRDRPNEMTDTDRFWLVKHVLEWWRCGTVPNIGQATVSALSRSVAGQKTLCRKRNNNRRVLLAADIISE